MRREIFDYFQIAAQTATSKNDRRHFLLGCVGVRSDGAVVKSLNSPTEDPRRDVHSEFRISRKIDYGATVYVARVRYKDGGMAMARPCRSCMKSLISKRVKKIYYTISDNSYGIIDLNKNYERIVIDKELK